MDKNRAWISFWFTVILVAFSHTQFSDSLTDERDVTAINNLFTSLGSPPIPGWTANGGDPCAEQWQGVQCVNSNITSITINAANLGGELGNSLGSFTSIITLDLSNNNIGGTIPENLPITIQRIFLSANQLTGSIPTSLSQLAFLTDMSLNNNLLSGELPDSFQSLTGLINLDLSSNNLSGPLPPSMASLSSLTTLHIQQNRFSGVLDVLEDLPLKDLNIENNSFSGPIPEKLLSIPTFKKDGNPFNTSIIIAPSAQPPATATPPFFSGAPSASKNHTNSSSPSESGSNNKNSSPSSPSSSNKKSNTSTLKIIGYALVAVVSFIVLVLTVLFCLSKIQERRSREDEYAPAKAQASRVHGRVNPPIVRDPPVKQNNEVKKAAKEDSCGRLDLEIGRTIPAVPKREAALSDKKNSYTIDMDNSTDEFIMPPPPPPPPSTPPPPPPPPPPPAPVREVANTSTSTVPATSATSFSVASLQQYTRSFSEDNLIRESRLGRVYLAELPEGELLEVMKIDNANSRIAVDEFLEMVANISELRHPNVLELVGYCAEFGQRLLVYMHFSRKTLQDVLHDDDASRRSLAWNARIKIALGAAKALEYLHEGCQPQIVHQNFEPSNILVDRKLSVRVAECGLASLMPRSSVAQLSGRMRSLYYEAPEISESGSSFTDRSDVYSFGVIMLELLTGRKPYDASRPRAEQHLVRWASSQLHDIDALFNMVDPAIKGMCSDKSLSNFADIITRCIQHEPEFRPPMSEIVQDLASMVRPSREPSK
ncbi:hypothetical protein LUZ63_000474 [Rhynchospora breviuscula]|uniref:Protein kinase domain-containing protein n=1 Tax=Rhynchospora breviuscula TaxID=2022672 RepID=A0A9Q0HWP1_9POAL|nr:hypothetical protein LUZ63_000474 [Rhynchospora breviuscula]